MYISRIEVYIITACLTFLAVVTVILRFWARSKSVAKYGLDDWLIVVAMVFTIGGLVPQAESKIYVLCLYLSRWLTVSKVIESAMQLQNSENPVPILVKIGKAFYAGEIWYPVNITIIKISILVMYCRMFPIEEFKIGAYILGALSVAWALTFVLLFALQCVPVAKTWDPTINGKCLNLKHVSLGSALINILTDAAILAMPIYHVWQMRLRRAQKIALLAIFMLGAFTIFASIYRLVQVLAFNPANLNETIGAPVLWSNIEIEIALICACLPTLRPLLTALTRTFRTRTSEVEKLPHNHDGFGPNRINVNAQSSLRSNATTLTFNDDRNSFKEQNKGSLSVETV